MAESLSQARRASGSVTIAKSTFLFYEISLGSYDVTVNASKQLTQNDHRN